MKISIVYKASILLALAAGGCATATAPGELLTARTAYTHAQSGTAGKLNPADLDTAKKALDAAEHNFAEEGDTQHTRDLAYVADRRAQIAEARADATLANQEQQQSVAEMHANEAKQMKATSAELGRANQKLAVQGEAMKSQDAQLATEREARAAAEKRAAQAAADLSKFASVKTVERGMVITLADGVLFQSGKAELLPTAQVKLNSVADALTQQDPESKMVVEGHTDSQGKVSFNQGLSERRAQSVRDYLVTRGIAADRVSARGLGSTQAIADNASAEGRANNRRVEIIVQPVQTAAR